MLPCARGRAAGAAGLLGLPEGRADKDQRQPLRAVAAAGLGHGTGEHAGLPELGGLSCPHGGGCTLFGAR